MATNTSCFDIKIVNRADPLEIITLYKEAGWWKNAYDNDTSFLDEMVKGSTCFAGAFYQQDMVGMGRAISDGVSDAYIQDVVVLERYRKKGLGKRIIQVIIETLTKRGVDWIGLISTPGSQDFYKSAGFKPMEGHTPFVYKG